jgi:hypothetical protein
MEMQILVVLVGVFLGIMGGLFLLEQRRKEDVLHREDVRKNTGTWHEAHLSTLDAIRADNGKFYEQMGAYLGEVKAQTDLTLAAIAKASELLTHLTTQQKDSTRACRHEIFNQRARHRI